MEKSNTHEFYMRMALQQAQLAAEKDEVPIGAVLVAHDRVICRAHNMTQQLNDATAHAEMLALTSAMDHFGSKYLKDCTLYVSLEPCVMCSGAAAWAQLGALVFAAIDEKKGYQKLAPHALHPKTKVITGVLAQESEALLKSYFQRKRNS
jgi:tRNA(adenine34) deaminase